MSKARNLADFISTGVGTGILADGAISTTEITGVTATSAEINKLAGLTASTSELNNVSAIATAALPKAGGTMTGAFTQDGGAVFNEASADVDFRVESNGNANMLFVDGGNDRVGIGTAPDQLLHLASSAPDLRIEDTDGGYADFNIDGGSIELRADQGNSVSSSSIKMFVDATERLRISSAGNVGIGTSSPLRQLSLQNSGNTEMSFVSGTSGNCSILMGDGTTGADFYRGYVQYQNANDSMLFATSSQERMRINASGEISGTSFQEHYTALSGTTPSIDADTGGYFSLTTSGNTTFTFAAVTTGRSVGFLLEILAGGGHTLTWPSTVDWGGGTAPDAPASGAKNLYVFTTRDSGTNWIGALASAAYA